MERLYRVLVASIMFASLLVSSFGVPFNVNASQTKAAISAPAASARNPNLVSDSPHLTVVTENATAIAANSATLTGNLTSLGNSTSVQVSFEWGSTTAYGNTTAAQIMNATGSFSATITGLTPNKTYHFRAGVTGNGTALGAEKTFVSSKKRYTLTVNATGPGGVSKDPDQPDYVQGTVVKLTASPGQGNSYLAAWGGDLTGRVSPANITMDGNKIVNATFQLYDPPPPAMEGYPWEGLTLGERIQKVQAALTENDAQWAEAQSLGIPSTMYYAAAHGGLTTLLNQLMAAQSGGGSSVPVYSGGGGGGGGGVSLLTIQYTSQSGTTVQGTIDPSGAVRATITACSTDKNITMNIPSGTLAKDGNNRPLALLDVSPAEGTPDPPASAGLLGNPYEFSPPGATFAPPFAMTWRYDPALLPAGVDETKLQVTVWDNVDGGWVPVEGANIDSLQHSISTEIAHFSTYAIFYRKPASFEYGKLTISPAETTFQEGKSSSTGISTVVTNTGGVTGSHTLVLKINGNEVARQEVTLEPGARKEVSFKETRNELGKYDVDLNGLTGEFVVKARPPAFLVGGFTLSALTVDPGENASASIYVANTGGSPGTYKATLYLDGAEKAAREVKLAAGASETLSFLIPAGAAGTHKVNINGLEGQLTVAEPSGQSGSFNWRLIGMIVMLAFVSIVTFILIRKVFLMTRY